MNSDHGINKNGKKKNKIDISIENYRKEIFKKMTIEEKLKLTLQLRQSAWDLKAAALRSLHPGWSRERVQEEVRKIFLYAKT